MIINLHGLIDGLLKHTIVMLDNNKGDRERKIRFKRVTRAIICQGQYNKLCVNPELVGAYESSLSILFHSNQRS